MTSVVKQWHCVYILVAGYASLELSICLPACF